MKVSYVISFYNGECDGRFGRFHDWVHTLRDMDEPPFEFDVHAFMASNPDSTLASIPSSYLGSGGELWGTQKNTLEKLLNLPRVMRQLNSHEPDITHIISFDPIVTLPILSLNINTQFIIGPNIGGWYPNRTNDHLHKGEVSRWKLWCKYIARKSLVKPQSYSKAVVFSKYHRNMIRYLGFEDESISVLRPGIRNMFSPDNRNDRYGDNNKIELLYVGKLSNQKGYELLLHAISKIDIEIQLRVIGSGNPQRELIQSLGLANQVIIEGFVDRANLPECYRSADLFVIPSIDEMSPNTQFEALACGTPIVATDTPGINEFVPSDAAEFFWPRDSDTLATSLRSAIDHLDSLSKAANAHAGEYHAENTVAQLYETYQSVLSK